MATPNGVAPASARREAASRLLLGDLARLDDPEDAAGAPGEDRGCRLLEQSGAGDHRDVDIGGGQCVEERGEPVEQRVGAGGPGGQHSHVVDARGDEAVPYLAVEPAAVGQRQQVRQRRGVATVVEASRNQAWRGSVATRAAQPEASQGGGEVGGHAVLHLPHG